MNEKINICITVDDSVIYERSFMVTHIDIRTYFLARVKPLVEYFINYLSCK